MSKPDTVSFQVVVPNNNYFSIGFGSTMRSTDMVVWMANGYQSQTIDLWSTGHDKPLTDGQQDYNTTK